MSKSKKRSKDIIQPIVGDNFSENNEAETKRDTENEVTMEKNNNSDLIKPRKIEGKPRTVSIILNEEDWLLLQEYNLYLQRQGMKPIKCSALGRELVTEWIDDNCRKLFEDGRAK